MRKTEFNDALVRAVLGVTQNAEPAMYNGTCQYVTEAGARCVVGHAFPGAPFKECLDVSQQVEAIDGLNLDDLQVQTLSILQRAHDTSMEDTLYPDVSFEQAKTRFVLQALPVLRGQGVLPGHLLDAGLDPKYLKWENV